MKAKPVLTVGRRKTAIARVTLWPAGKGDVVVNGRPIDQYFTVPRLRQDATEALKHIEADALFDVHVNVHGGGPAGQAGAMRHALARALQVQNPAIRPPLKKAGMLRRDPRMVERKKYGRHKARRGTQFSKR